LPDKTPLELVTTELSEDRVPKRSEDQRQITGLGPKQHYKLLSGAPRMKQQECTYHYANDGGPDHRESAKN
jgi:hypothetical protein